MAEFFGRGAELQRLASLANESMRLLCPVAAVVTAEPGAGKTRLLNEVRSRLAVDLTLAMAGFEPEEEIDLAAGAALLRSIGLSVRSSEATTVGLFEAAHLRVDARPGPVLLLVDDLQWVDDTSLALIHYLVRGAEASHHPMVVIAAGRPSPRSNRFADSVARLLGARLLVLGLGPLPTREGILLAQAVSPGLDHRAARLVWERSAGSPFWIEILASGTSDAPAAEVVGRRLAACRQAAVDVAEALAVVAKGVPVAALSEVLDLPAEEASSGAGELADVGLAVQESGVIRLAHDLIRTAVLERIPTERMRRLHRRVAEWLRARAGDDPLLALEALQHSRAGGLSVVEGALELVESPGRRLLGTEGLIRLAGMISPDDTGRDVVDLRRALMELAAELGDHETAWRQAQILADVVDDPRLSAEIGLAASRSLVELGHIDAAWSWLDRAAGLPDPSQALVVEALAQRSILHRVSGNLSDAVELAARAVDIGRSEPASPPMRRAHLRALSAAADAALFAGHPASMVRLNEELARAAAGIDERLRLRAAAAGSLGRRLLGHNVEAAERLATAFEEARQMLMPQATLEAGASLGVVLLSLGRIEEAQRLATELEALHGRLVEVVPARAYMDVLPQLVQITTGAWREGADGLREAAARSSVPHYRLHAHLERAVALARIGPDDFVDDIRESSRSALTDAEEAGCARCLRESLLRLGESLARIRDRDGARTLLARADTLLEPSDALAGWWLSRSRLLVEAAASEGLDEEALESVAVDAERLGLKLEALWVRYDQGRALADLRPESAVEVLEKLSEECARLGAVTLMRLADQTLRRLGVRTWRRGARLEDGWMSSLTEREHQVAAMVAAGASNPEIAESLFLSRRTVERHLTNILAKAGVRNRAELAARVSSEVGGDHR